MAPGQLIRALLRNSGAVDKAAGWTEPFRINIVSVSSQNYRTKWSGPLGLYWLTEVNSGASRNLELETFSTRTSCQPPQTQIMELGPSSEWTPVKPNMTMLTSSIKLWLAISFPNSSSQEALCRSSTSPGHRDRPSHNFKTQRWLCCAQVGSVSMEMHFSRKCRGADLAVRPCVRGEQELPGLLMQTVFNF
jgi:hypothetical protein